MKKSKIAAQLYTVRDFLKTPSEIAASLKKVKAAGYDAVQVSGLGPVDTKELKKMLDGEGLICCATHEPGLDIIENTEKVIEKLKILDCEYTAYPYPHVKLDSKDACIALAESLNEAGQKMAEADLVLCYHNHAIEFQRYGRKTALEIIYDETDAEFLQAELDTYWVQYGGASPEEWCKDLEGRLPLIHLKEYGIVNNEIKMLEIGNGSLNWKKIVKAAKKAGTEWFIVEQDVCRIDPFESLKISLEYLVNEVK